MKSRSTGQLFQGGRVIIEEADFEVEEFEVVPGGIKEWRGSFVIPAAKLFSRGTYEIVLDDGFSGGILLKSDQFNGTIHFIGQGKPNRQG